MSAPQSGIKSFKDLVKLSKTDRNISVGTYGNYFRVGLAVLGTKLGEGLNVVPYNGPMQTLNGVLEGTLKLALVDLGTALPLIKSGKLNAIATTGKTRHSALPEVETVAENGFPDFEVRTFLGFGISAKTPEPIAKELEKNLLEAMNDPAFRSSMEKMDGVEITAQPSAAFVKIIDESKAHFSNYLRLIGGKIPQ